MALTVHPTAPAAPSLPRPRRGTTERSSESLRVDWREAITDFRPPAGPDGCWASGSPAAPRDDAATSG